MIDDNIFEICKCVWAYWSLIWTFAPDRQSLPLFTIKNCVVRCRRKSSTGMIDTENERTSNIYGESTASSQPLGNGVPLEDMPNNSANMGSGPEHPTPPSNASAQPIYSVVRKDREGNVVNQSANQSKYLLTVVVQWSNHRRLHLLCAYL